MIRIAVFVGMIGAALSLFDALMQSLLYFLGHGGYFFPYVGTSFLNLVSRVCLLFFFVTLWAKQK